MKKKLLLALVVEVTILFLLTGSSFAKQKKVFYKKVPRISAQVAFYMHKSGKAVLVDAMNPVAFSRYHILGAINIPNDGVKDQARLKKAKLPFKKSQPIIVYCD